MTTNNRYLPLFFLCWAFLYSPVAVWSVWPIGGGGQEIVVKEERKVVQGLQATEGEQAVPDDFSCLCTIYGNAAWGFNCNLNFMAPFYLTHEQGGSHGIK